ncbi:hypothetical protein [Falsirhodobacter algicola]|uniref:Pterin-binding domain-containing protein n=1 Tax=Falsirhodobacter algicola TaxID=2692330 RepID=A0A8J8MU85_9RHOB|nr:hypothetical protein [Falsirhodobacter algicola]QUS36544.1 hypothetical protein GR316_09885 [Falsirhodobacter algicola]
MTTTAAALIALAGAASAQTAAPGDLQLSSGAIEQLETLEPNLDISTLTPIQINEINEEVNGDGLDQGELITILEDM